jgi:hypothetical protein
MTDDPVKQALAELQDLVRCRCHPAYTGRGLRDPDCECDSTEAVKAVADHIEAQAAEIETLRAERDEFEAMAIRAAKTAKELTALLEKLRRDAADLTKAVAILSQR